MPIQKTITLYTYSELPTDKAKERAREWWRALRERAREHCMPPVEYVKHGSADNLPMRTESVYGPKKQSAGDWLRAYFRREFGRGVANRWFS